MFRRSGVVVSAIVLLSATLFGGSANAGHEWCEEDPEFVVNGGVVDVTTIFDGAYARSVRPPVTFVMHVPSNATAAVLSLPGTVPVTGKVVKDLPASSLIGGTPVVVYVTVNASRAFATSTYVSGTYGRITAATAGRSNTTTVIKFTLLAR